MEILKSNGRTVWNAQIESHPALWSVAVGAEVIDELLALTKDVADLDALIQDYQPGMFKLEAIDVLARRVRGIVDHQIGFCQVRFEDDARLSDQQLRLLYLLLSLQLGDHCGHYKRLHEVKDQGYDYRKVPVSVSMTKNFAPLHTDCTLRVANPNVIGLMCLCPAMHGGESLVINASTVYDKIKRNHPEIVETLHGDYYRLPVTPWDRKFEGEWNKFPVFAFDDDGAIEFRYMRYWLEEGYRELGVEMSEEQKGALGVLDGHLEKGEDVAQIPLTRGDILYCNNRYVAHSRNHFEDSPDLSKQRLLLRTWLSFRD